MIPVVVERWHGTGGGGDFQVGRVRPVISHEVHKGHKGLLKNYPFVTFVYFVRAS